MKDGRKKVSSKATFRGIFEDHRASPRALFSCENVNNKKRESGKLSAITWFLYIGATGFEPAT